MKRKILLILVMLLLPAITVFAHGGKTDAAGGHRDNQNKSGLGYYHYHCDGHPAHLHKDGVCPYKQSFAPKSSSNNNNIIISDGTVTKSKEKSENVTIEFDNKPKKTEKAPEQVPEEEPEQSLILTILKWILGGLWILWMIGIVGTILMSIIEYIAESRGCLITVLVCIGLIIIYIVYKVIST